MMNNDAELTEVYLDSLNSALVMLVEKWKLEEQTRGNPNDPDIEWQRKLKELVEQAIGNDGLYLELVVRNSIENEIDNIHGACKIGNDMDNRYKLIVVGLERESDSYIATGFPKIALSAGRVGMSVVGRGRKNSIVYPSEVVSAKFIKPQQKNF